MGDFGGLLGSQSWVSSEFIETLFQKIKRKLIEGRKVTESLGLDSMSF